MRPIRPLVSGFVLALTALVTAPLAVLVGPAQAAAPSVVINEVESDGDVFDWVELYNTGSTAVDLSAMVLMDDQTRTLKLPAGTTLEAGAYVAINVDDKATPGSFGLGKADQIRLFAADGTTLVDSYAWTEPALTTYGRCPNGTGAFKTMGSATKGALNDCRPVGADKIRLNEVESNGGTPGDWVELVNTGTYSVDVSGWVLKDNDDTHSYAMPAGTTLAGGGYLALEEAAFGFGLGAADSARLFLPDGTSVDSHAWTAHASTTYGRCPNPAGDFSTTAAPTKGAANDCGVVVPTTVKINEVESNGGTPGDWVELVNTGTTPVDLSGWGVIDNDVTHSWAKIPAGTTIAPGGYFVVEETLLGFGLGAADSVTLRFSDDSTVIDSYAWTTHAPVTYARCPNGTGPFDASMVSTKGAANDCSAPVRINEVESSGGTPGDWIELMNVGRNSVDVSGWVLKDNVDTNAVTLPAGTSIAAGAFLAVDVDVAGGFGLGAADSARVYAADSTLIDSYNWTAHAATTYGRCPDGTGAFESTKSATKGAANDCAGPAPATPWPGGADVAISDASGDFPADLSGLAYQVPQGSTSGTLWAVVNGTGVLHKLQQTGGNWTKAGGEWAAGKTLRYPDGTGTPDAEGVALVAGSPAAGVYVATERNNANGSVSRPAILRFEPDAAGTTLKATHDWNLTADLPAVGANLGLEGITWVPDSALTAAGFIDEAKQAPYDPASYPDHGTGLFFVGVEASGTIYAYALNHTTGAFTRVATFSSGFPAVMELQWDADAKQLWAVCDNTCEGKHAVLTMQGGKFAVKTVYARPAGMPNLNNEGFAFAGDCECVAGKKLAFWSDDSATGGHALRTGSLDCVSATTTPTSTATPSGTATPTSAAAPTVTVTATATATATVTATATATVTRTATVTSAPTATVTVTATAPPSPRKPVIIAIASSDRPLRNGWYARPVTVTFYCSEEDRLATPCPGPVTVGSGADQSVSRTITTTDGAASTATVSGLNVDLDKPSVSIAMRRNKPQCVASDPLSGVEACTMRLERRGGSKRIVVATATDRAGNVNTARMKLKR